jgi:hypothetical protein
VAPDQPAHETSDFVSFCSAFCFNGWLLCAGSILCIAKEASGLAARAMRHVFWMTGLVWLLLGCGGHGPRTVTNPDLQAKVPAIEDAARRRDRSAIPELVKELDSDDAAVRFYAIRGLRAITGGNFGYRYYDSEEDRQAAVLRWKQWLRDQKSK